MNDLHHILRDPILIILVIASFISWAIIVERVLALLLMGRSEQAVLGGEAVADAPLYHLRQEVEQTAGVAQEKRLVLLDTTITAQRHRLERGLPLLGVIGSAAPYAGLLGTVIGIIQAFQAIHQQNTMNPSVVSAGISIALIATAIGLGVAIPAVVAHHLLHAAITRRVAGWESHVARWLAEEPEKGERHEPVACR